MVLSMATATMSSAAATAAATAPAASCCAKPDAALGASIAETLGTSLATVGTATRSAWLPPANRVRSFPREMAFVDQEGRPLTSADFAGKPMAVSFFFTRCDNTNKCPLIASTMANLQAEVKEAGLADKVQLLLVSYDPEHDRPAILKQYALSHGFGPSPAAKLLQPDARRKRGFFDALDLAVNFNRQGVNIHGIELMLFDRNGRYVRSYQRVIWKNALILADLKTLASEAD